ncbi:hypothetical protein H0N95_01035, partial [Candidatus Micrarchaeota archaeon]|nr:hypothetical protein [Candidatus Micrarchaeota archaeon]
MTTPTNREMIEKTREALRQKALEMRMKAEEKAKKDLESHGIEASEFPYFFKQALRANIMRETGKLARAEQIESELNTDISLYKKLKKEAEGLSERLKKAEILPLRPQREINENTMHDLRSLEKNIGVKIFDGERISENAKNLAILVIRKNVAATQKEMEGLFGAIIKEAEAL